jgi:hypothetical protein
MRRVLTFLIGLLLVTSFVVTAAGSAWAGGPTNINVSMRSFNQSEAASAVDPVNSQNVVIVSNTDSGGGLFMGVSHDGGTTWTRSIFAKGGTKFGDACCDPTMSWDDSGNLFLVWLSSDDFGAVPVALSTDAGDTWKRLAVLHPKAPGKGATAMVPVRGVETGSSNGDGNGNGRPKSAIDQPTVATGHNAVWVVWNNHGSMQAAGARVVGLGDVKTFLKRQDIPHTDGCSFGDAAVGPTGAVMQVCTRDLRTTPVRAEIRVNVDADGLGHRGFSAGHRIGITNVQQWDSIPPQKDRTVDAETGLAWDRSGGPHDGRVTMIYTDESPNESGNTNNVTRYSDDSGKTWTDPVRVNSVGNNAQFNPKIAIDQINGVMAAAWHDARLDLGDHAFGDTNGRPNDDATVFMAFSTDGGQSWGPDFRVSSGVSNAKDAQNGIDYGDYIGLSFSNGTAYPAWADNSNDTGDNPDGSLGSFDIYTAHVVFCC